MASYHTHASDQDHCGSEVPHNRIRRSTHTTCRDPLALAVVPSNSSLPSLVLNISTINSHLLGSGHGSLCTDHGPYSMSDHTGIVFTSASSCSGSQIKLTFAFTDCIASSTSKHFALQRLAQRLALASSILSRYTYAIIQSYVMVIVCLSRKAIIICRCRSHAGPAIKTKTIT
jgi:hypothetical protein